MAKKLTMLVSSLNKIKISEGIIAVLLLLFFNNNISAQGNINEYDVKKALIFKITRFVEWPENSKVNTTKSPIVISILGKDPFEGEFNKMANNKHYKIKNKIVIVRNIKSVDEIKGSDILFISSTERYNISKIIKYTHNKPILTFGDTKGYMEKGVMISLILSSRRILFYINNKEANACELYINSQLLGNAIKVIK